MEDLLLAFVIGLLLLSCPLLSGGALFGGDPFSTSFAVAAAW